MEQNTNTSFDLALTGMPALTDLELAMRRTACGKAQGGDGLRGELLHYFVVEMAPLVYPALWKLMLHGQEDLSYKGGLLVQAYKGRGPAHACASFRSLLISGQIGKSLHRTVRTAQATLLDGPNALELAELPHHMKTSIAAIHNNTHFWMREQEDVVETAFGSRPGDPFADVCFSYMFGPESSIVFRTTRFSTI